MKESGVRACETVVRLPFAADCCPCVEKLGTVLPFSAGWGARGWPQHTNPCGVASRDDLLEAYRLAVIADPISAFGGIVAFNRPLTEELAKELREFRSPTDGAHGGSPPLVR